MITSTTILHALMDLTDASTEPGDGQTCELVKDGDLTVSAYRRESSHTLTVQATVNGHTYTSLPILHWQGNHWRLDPSALLRVSEWLGLVRAKI